MSVPQDAGQLLLAEHVHSLQSPGHHALQLSQQAVLQQLLGACRHSGAAVPCTIKGTARLCGQKAIEQGNERLMTCYANLEMVYAVFRRLVQS